MQARSTLALILLILTLLMTACAGQAAPQAASKGRPAEAPAQQPPAPAGEADALGSGNPALAQASIERKIIRDVSLSLRVKDTAAAADQIAVIAAAAGGYVSSTNLHEGSDRQLQGTITIRVDATRLDDAIKQIKALSMEVLAEQSNTHDVTEEYVDLQARLENLQRTEKELQALLTEIRQNTRRAEDVLAVYRELTQIRGEIEQVQGRINYLDNLANLATVTITLSPPEAIVQDPSWSPSGTAQRAVSTLISGLQGIISAAIFLVIAVLPLLVIMLLPLLLLVWLIRRWRSGRVLRPAE
ncbi:MAG: DUF4349 domain-containing protein [Ardenticatenaceae bacterium]|nr:DUF4349 domain-containing protein [Ardenticatenaceae bacterium]